MSNGQMRVDYDRLGELASNLEYATRVVGSEAEHMGQIAWAVGDARLAFAVGDFRNSWDKRRLDLVNDLEWLRDSVRNIHERLAETDASLASGLSAPASAAGAAGSNRAV